jgi:hypothetical protein
MAATISALNGWVSTSERIIAGTSPGWLNNVCSSPEVWGCSQARSVSNRGLAQ